MFIERIVLCAAVVASNLAAAAPSTVEARGKQVVGGTAATVSDFPYVVSLNHKGGDQFCGGSLLNNETVLTAAHCVVDETAARVTIRAGSVRFDSGGVTADGSRIVVHPKYDADSSHADIAIVKLAKPIEAQSGIQYVSLPASGFELAGGTRVKAAGWGVIDTAGTIYSDILRMVEVPVVPRATCLRSWPGIIDETMVCAGEALGGKDVCFGDSGGPLVLAGTSTIVGTVSFGKPCALAGFPSVYGNVAGMLDFILENL